MNMCTPHRNEVRHRGEEVRSGERRESFFCHYVPIYLSPLAARHSPHISPHSLKTQNSCWLPWQLSSPNSPTGSCVCVCVSHVCEVNLVSCCIQISQLCSWNDGAGTTVTDLKSFFSFLQQSLLRQQERVEERVQEIEEQLCKLDSDKCVVEVCFYAPAL